MADPFEVRMRFTSQLQHLNASVNSSQKAASFVLKYRDLDEDLHSCILEQLERNNMNNRANIMYFIEHLCDMAQRENYMGFVKMVQRDIVQIVDAVAPGDGTGAANVKIVRKVLGALQSKSFLDKETVAKIESALSERDTLPEHPSPSSAPKRSSEPTPNRQNKSNSSIIQNGRLDKKQIETRIEEDRERHKRLRESIWAVSSAIEAKKTFEEASDFEEDDEIVGVEDKADKAQFVPVKI